MFKGFGGHGNYMRVILRAVMALLTLVFASQDVSAQTGWTSTGNLNQYRYGHTSTLLPSGKVLIVGGWFADQHAELYDPIAGTFSVTGSMIGGHRNGHFAVLSPNGKVLVGGGQ